MVSWSRIQSLYQSRPERHARAAQLMGLLCPPPVFIALFHERHADSGIDQVLRGIDVSRVGWTLDARCGADFRDVFVDRAFQRAVDEAYEAALQRPYAGAEGIDGWSERGTWMQPPILISGEVLGSAVRDTLLVGCTRLGRLLALLDRGLVAESSHHMIWIGTPK